MFNLSFFNHENYKQVAKPIQGKMALFYSTKGFRDTNCWNADICSFSFTILIL